MAVECDFNDALTESGSHSSDQSVNLFSKFVAYNDINELDLPASMQRTVRAISDVTV